LFVCEKNPKPKLATYIPNQYATEMSITNYHHLLIPTTRKKYSSGNLQLMREYHTSDDGLKEERRRR